MFHTPQSAAEFSQSSADQDASGDTIDLKMFLNDLSAKFVSRVCSHHCISRNRKPSMFCWYSLCFTKVFRQHVVAAKVTHK